MAQVGPANHSIAGQRLVPGEHVPLAGPFGIDGDSVLLGERGVPSQGHDAKR